MTELLRVENLWAGYGDAVVLEELSFSLHSGDSLALLGRNGMGKTTLLATLMGATRQLGGKIYLQGQDISAMPSHKRATAGLGWVPQERDVFRSLTVEENLSVVARAGHWDLAKVYELFPRLLERRANLGSQLSGGEQQMLAMGRALMLNPRILLLDEPLEGLAPLIAQELLRIIERMVQQSQMAVILVEQHARQILPITRQALILERGKAVHASASMDLLANDELIDKWLAAGATKTPTGTPTKQAKANIHAIAAIEVIHAEHRAIAAILKALEWLIQAIEANQIKPDFQLLASIIEYIAEMPDKLHHPKEDRIYALLRLQNPPAEVLQALDKLAEDHQKAPFATGLLDRSLINYLQNPAGGFAGFKAVASDYIAQEWQHMNTEEKIVLPVARELIADQAWEPISQDFAANINPWSGPGEKYASLFSQIAALAPAPQGLGQ